MDYEYLESLSEDDKLQKLPIYVEVLKRIIREKNREYCEFTWAEIEEDTYECKFRVGEISHKFIWEIEEEEIKMMIRGIRRGDGVYIDYDTDKIPFEYPKTWGGMESVSMIVKNESNWMYTCMDKYEISMRDEILKGKFKRFLEGILKSRGNKMKVRKEKGYMESLSEEERLKRIIKYIGKLEEIIAERKEREYIFRIDNDRSDEICSEYIIGDVYCRFHTCKEWMNVEEIREMIEGIEEEKEGIYGREYLGGIKVEIKEKEINVYIDVECKSEECEKKGRREYKIELRNEEIKEGFVRYLKEIESKLDRRE